MAKKKYKGGSVDNTRVQRQPIQTDNLGVYSNEQMYTTIPRSNWRKLSETLERTNLPNPVTDIINPISAIGRLMQPQDYFRDAGNATDALLNMGGDALVAVPATRALSRGIVPTRYATNPKNVVSPHVPNSNGFPVSTIKKTKGNTPNPYMTEYSALNKEQQILENFGISQKRTKTITPPKDDNMNNKKYRNGGNLPFKQSKKSKMKVDYDWNGISPVESSPLPVNPQISERSSIVPQSIETNPQLDFEFLNRGNQMFISPITRGYSDAQRKSLSRQFPEQILGYPTLRGDDWYNLQATNTPKLLPYADYYENGGNIKRKKAQWGQLINPTYEESGIYDEEVNRRNQVLGDQYQPINQQQADFQGNPNYVSQSWNTPTPTEGFEMPEKKGSAASDKMNMIAGAAQQGMKQLGNISKGAFNAIPALTSLIPEQQRTRRNILINDNQSRPHSQAIMNNGGSIDNTYVNRRPVPQMLSPEEQASLDIYTTHYGKTANQFFDNSRINTFDPITPNFIRNQVQTLGVDQARKYYNTPLPAPTNLKYQQGGVIERIADNPIDGPTMLLKGPSHENGGIPLNIFGQQIEAEGQETIHFANNGVQVDSAVIGGNLSTKYNGKKTKFKNIFKDIAEKDKKANKQESKGLELIIDKDPTNPFEALAFNSGRMLAEGAQVKYEQNAEARDLYTQIQNQMLMEKANTSNKAKDGKTIFAKEGTKIDRENLLYRQMAHSAAINAQIDPRVFNRLVAQESSWNPKAKSSAGAKGIVQFTTDTAKQYGIENILDSDKPEDVEKVLYAGAQHFKKLLDNYGGDYNAALIAYNAGPGGKNIDKGYEAIKRWTSKELNIPIEEVTGADALDYLREVRIKRPSTKQSAYSNETLGYVSSIMGYGPMSDYTTQADFNAPIQSIPSYGGDPSKDPFRTSQIHYQNTQERTPITIPVSTDPFSETGLSGEGIPQPIPYQPTGREIESDTLTPVSNTSEQPLNITSQNINRGSLADSIGLPWENIAAALPAIFDRPDYVGRQYYNPTLEDPYSISLQDQRNQINAGFRSVERQLPNNPEALAALAGQRYQAENQVSAQEFRTNQELLNTVLNRNVQTLNQAQQLNNQYADLQMDRQTRAKAVTDDRRQQALSSLADTFAKQRQLKTNIRMLEGTMPYAYNTQTNQYDLVRPEAAPFNFAGTPQTPTRRTSRTKDGDTTETVTWDDLRYLQAQQKAQQASQQNLLTRIMGTN